MIALLFWTGAILLAFGVLAGVAEYLDGKESGS